MSSQPKISVITPSIRPEGLKVVFDSLKEQTFTDWEWLPRLSVPKDRSDLSYQMNKALDEANGELIVFWQDYIRLHKGGLERAWSFYRQNANAAFTMPVGKEQEIGAGEFTLQDENVVWDWRAHRRSDEKLKPEEWEIDFGAVPREAIGDERFFERYDEGFGWENVDLAHRLSKKGVRFLADKANLAIAYDHDAHMDHPYRHNPNQMLWQSRKAILDLDV